MRDNPGSVQRYKRGWDEGEWGPIPQTRDDWNVSSTTDELDTRYEIDQDLSHQSSFNEVKYHQREPRGVILGVIMVRGPEVRKFKGCNVFWKLFLNANGKKIFLLL